ncbi:MAG: DUF362 domain-containing protein [Eubacteriales bacterium]
MSDPNAKVFLCRKESYDPDALIPTLSDFFDGMGLDKDFFVGKKVVIKPNLVRKMDASLGGTTHPAILKAVAAVLHDRGVQDLLLAESPGGIYTESSLRAAYRVCGMEKAAEESGVRLNFDTSCRELDAPDGVKSKVFRIITPIADADVIVNLCKLKSHGLTTMTAAVKNYFGTIPGTEKFEMHARFPDLNDFSGMIVDLCALHTSRATTVNIVDAIVGMEGNGPTNGTPRKIGLLGASLNPFALDAVCQQVLGMEGKVKMVDIAAERGYFHPDETEVIGERVEDVKIPDFKLPDSSIQITSVLTNSRFLKMFEPRPSIDRSACVGCGECVRSCPKKTITLNKQKRRAEIHPSACIRCFCCQELCPHDAVRIRRNPLLKWIK